MHERDKVLLGMLSASSNKAGKHNPQVICFLKSSDWETLMHVALSADAKPVTQRLSSSSGTQLPDINFGLSRLDSDSSAVIEAALKEQQSLMSGMQS